MNGLDSSHAAALDTARYQNAGPVRVPAHSPPAMPHPDAVVSSPSQSNTDIGLVADEFTAAILQQNTVVGQMGIFHGDTVYDPFVGSGMTPAVAVRLVPQHPPAAA